MGDLLRSGLLLGESDLGPKGRLLGDGDLLTGGLILGNGEPLRLGENDLFLDLDLLIGRLAGECVLERRGERRLGDRDLDLECLGGGLLLGDLDLDLLGGGLLRGDLDLDLLSLERRLGEGIFSLGGNATHLQDM